MPRCIWCGRDTDELTAVQVKAGMGDKETVKVCSEECGRRISEYTDYAYSHLGLFAIGLILPFIIGMILFIMSSAKNSAIFSAFGVLVMLGGIGLTVYKFPFVTPQVNEKYGALKGIKIGKIIAIVIIALSILLFFLVQL